LVDEEVVEWVVSLPSLKGKEILEVGAGRGALTILLSKKAKEIKAIELDPALAESLEGKCAELDLKNVEVVNADALNADFGDSIIFGNVPFQISSPLLFKFLASESRLAVLFLQKEFAERLVVQPGSRDYSRLSAMVQAKCECEIVLEVPRNCFQPVPETDACVVRIEKKPEEDALKLNEVIVNALFQHKKKTLRNALRDAKGFLRGNNLDSEKIVESLDSKFLEKRVFCLTPGELAEISGVEGK
jgi:16S rRNA (adenine1518-N6/adenine1519-N6)-dimethyltransferase